MYYYLNVYVVCQVQDLFFSAFILSI